MAATASFLVCQHLHERTRPRVERAWLQGAGVGAISRVYVAVYVGYVRRERCQSDCHRHRATQPLRQGQCAAYNVALQPFLFCD